MKHSLLFILMLGLLSSPAFAATTYYVSLGTNTPPGNDSNPGTIGAPFLHFSKCNAVLTAGDTCYVRGGTYTSVNGVSGGYTIGGCYAPSGPNCTDGTQTIPGVNHGTSWANVITFAAYPGETVNVVNNDGHGFTNFTTENFPTSRSFYWVVDGFHFDMSNHNDGNQSDSGVSAISALWADYIEIKNVEVKNCWGVGITPASRFWKFTNLNVHDNGIQKVITYPGLQTDHGLYCNYCQGTIVSGGSYYNNTGYGIQFNSEGLDTNNDNVVHDALIYHNNRYGSQVGDGGGIVMSAGGNDWAYNNLVYDNGGNGMQCSALQHASGPCYFVNNTIYNNGVGDSGYAVLIGQARDQTFIEGNIIYGNGIGNAIQDNAPIQGHTSIISNNFFTDPSFTNVGINDFTIPSTSGAVGYALNLHTNGVLNGAVNVDVSTALADANGVNRLTSGSWTAGAYDAVTVPPPGLFSRSQIGNSCVLHSVTNAITCSLATNPSPGDTLYFGYNTYDATGVDPSVTSVQDCNGNSYVVESHHSVAGISFVGQAYTLVAPSNACKDVTATFSKNFTDAVASITDSMPVANSYPTYDAGNVAQGTGNVTSPTFTVSAPHEMVMATLNAGTFDTVNSPWVVNEGGIQNGVSGMAYVLDRTSNLAANFNATGSYDIVGMSVRACTPTHLQYGTQPANAVVGATMSSFTIEVRDANNLICDASNISIVISKNSGATWNNLAGTLTHTSSHGIATFTGVSITPTSGSGTIDATTAGLPSITSNSVTISSTVSFTVTPGSCQQSQTCTLTLTGSGTNWQNGVSVCTFSGTGVPSSNAIVANATSATCQAVVASNATVSVRNITITTTPEVETLANSLSIVAIPPNNTGGGKGIGRARGRSR